MATTLESSLRVYWILPDISDKNAGYRLRINPICQKLIVLGVNLEVISEQQLAQEINTIAEKASTVISSKPGNSRVYLCLKFLKQNNVRIIIDLFDNYFSWSPLVHHYGVYWNWLRVLELASEVIVSTSFLKNTLEYLFKASIRLVTDPLPVLLLEHGAISDNRILSKWQNPERLELLWFGINNNPYYNVGLDDLLSWLPIVQAIATQLSHRLDVSLSVCTKAVADVEIVLHVFNRNGISTKFVEWSEEVCDDLLKDSHVVLLPTKLNGFSLSKTHNRCSDALASGCLVLTNPNSPYREYGGGVMYSVNQLCDVLLSSNQAAIENLIISGLQRINDLANFDDLVNQFGLALTSTASAIQVNTNNKRSVLIASHTGIETIKLSRILGYFIASFKGSGIKANFDIYLEAFDVGSSTIKLVLSDKAYSYFISSIIGRFDLEWSGTKNNLVFIRDTWQFVFAKSSLTCVVKIHDMDDSLLKLSAISKMNHFHSDHLDLWFAEHVKLLCKALKLLNVTDIEIAGDDHHGWQDYTYVCSPALVQSKQVLNELWHNYLGHEIDLGRSMNKDASS